MTNRKLAQALGIKLTSVRTKCYELGLKRMELEYWTNEQIGFLLKNFKKYGDKELAELFNSRWPKKKTWTLKHIEKKRLYLKLKRTDAELLAIKERAKAKGIYKNALRKTWAKRGVTKEGEIRYWKRSKSDLTFPVIKVGNRFLHWGRYMWEKHYGPVPKGMNVIFKDGNNHNLSLSNLEMVSDGELSKRNSRIGSRGLSDNYIAGIITHGQPELREEVVKDKSLIQLKRQQLILNRTINEKISESTTADEG